MDAVIRSGRVGEKRARLGGARTEVSAAPSPQAVDDVVNLRVSTEALSLNLDTTSLRSEIEAALRLELEPEAQRLFEAHRQQGYEAGLAEGRQAAIEALRESEARCRAAFDLALAGWVDAHKDWRERVEQDVGDIAFSAICQFVGEHAYSRRFVEAGVIRACASLRGDAAVTVKLHPADKRLIEGGLAGLAQAQSPNLELVADASLASGGCVLEAASGGYDASLAAQLAELHAILTAKRAGEID